MSVDFRQVNLKQMLALGEADREATDDEVRDLEQLGPKGWRSRNHCAEAVRLADGSFLVCLHLPGFPGSDVTAPDDTEINYYHVTGYAAPPGAAPKGEA